MSRWWGQNIHINGKWLRETDDNYTNWMGRDAEQWESDVQEVFRKIERSRTGGLLMRLINEVSGRKILVFPIRAANFRQTAAKPADWTTAMRRGHQFECPATERCSGRPPAGGPGVATHSSLITGQGSGGNVYLYFHPGSWIAHPQMRAVDELLGFDTRHYNFEADDVLFHECVHAYRAMKGIFELVPTGDTWHATEEFFAVVLSNIYVSETRPNAPMRGDHSEEFHTLKEAGRTEGDKAFYLTNITLIERMIREMPELTQPLMETSPGKRIADWNPIRYSREIEEKRDMFNTGPAYLDLMR